MDKTELYNPVVFPELTLEDAGAISKANAVNDWGISLERYEFLVQKHETARKDGNVREMSKIEFLLTDINYHEECSLLRNGEYEKVLDGISLCF